MRRREEHRQSRIQDQSRSINWDYGVPPKKPAPSLPETPLWLIKSLPKMYENQKPTHCSSSRRPALQMGTTTLSRA